MPTIERFADGVPASAARILVDLYQNAGRRIQAMVLQPTGRTFQARQFNQARAALLARRIDEVLRAVKGFTVRWTASNLGAAVDSGIASAMRQLRQIGLRDDGLAVRGGLTQVDRRTVAVLAADMAVDLDAALTDQARRAQRYLRAAAQRIVPDSEISKVVAQAAITGDVRKAVREMRGLLAPAEIEDYRMAGRQIIEVGNAHMTVAAYAEMLVRTRGRAASVHARSERLVANGFDLVSIVGRVSVNFCTAYLGRVFSITGRDARYPSLSELPGGGPPFHPNCSKSTRLYSERFATDRQRRQAEMPDRTYVTRDAGDAQRLFDARDEMRNVRRRYRTTA